MGTHVPYAITHLPPTRGNSWLNPRVKDGTRFIDSRLIQGSFDLVGLVTYQGGMAARKRSPIPVLTGFNVEQRLSWDKRRYHNAKPPTGPYILTDRGHYKNQQMWQMRCVNLDIDWWRLERGDVSRYRVAWRRERRRSRLQSLFHHPRRLRQLYPSTHSVQLSVSSVQLVTPALKPRGQIHRHCLKSSK